MWSVMGFYFCSFPWVPMLGTWKSGLDRSIVEIVRSDACQGGREAGVWRRWIWQSWRFGVLGVRVVGERESCDSWTLKILAVRTAAVRGVQSHRCKGLRCDDLTWDSAGM
jgi:hypothetical protein